MFKAREDQITYLDLLLKTISIKLATRWSWFVSFPAASKGTQTNNDAVDLGKTTEGSGSETIDNTTSTNASLKKKAHLKKFFKEEEEKTSKNTHDDARLTIPADGRADTVELEELQKQATTNRKVSKISNNESLGLVHNMLKELNIGSISVALSCLVWSASRAPFPNSGWWSSLTWTQLYFHG